MRDTQLWLESDRKQREFIQEIVISCMNSHFGVSWANPNGRTVCRQALSFSARNDAAQTAAGGCGATSHGSWRGLGHCWAEGSRRFCQDRNKRGFQRCCDNRAMRFGAHTV